MFAIKNRAHHRYLVRLAISMSLYVATLFVATRLVGHGRVTGPLAYGLAILPGLCICGAFWAIGRFIVEETDEFLRLLLVRQSLVATAFSLSITTVWGFLENFRLVPHVDAFVVCMLWFIGLGVGAAINRVTLGTSGPA